MKKIINVSFILLFTLITSIAKASVVLERTRLIFPMDKSTLSLQIFNRSEQPTLVQSWIDDGDIASTPETTTAPFIVIPPIMKVSANGGAQLKIQRLENKLPQDRESIFYLNVLDIPPRPNSSENANTLQLALQTRIKLFYRPKQLELTSSTIFKQIEIIKKQQNLEINNPSAYFFTISKMYTQENIEQSLIEPTMIAPFSKQEVEYKGRINTNQVITVIYIDDDGNYQQDKKNIH
ncbi:molecular chaperone [Proteus penneri]|uniref:Molecular chaperone n=1 Tax=Proteus penneri TaxID=102862 RepID=A0ABS0W015_9GAMM|nr:molecular chaperone [Proteus penneri]MBJ2116657.1 molecular chaperone [Proteus penneri]